MRFLCKTKMSSSEEYQSTESSEMSSSEDSTSSESKNNKIVYGVTDKDRDSINQIVSRYGYNNTSEESHSDDELECDNLFESVLEEWETSKVCQIHNPHDILKTIPISYLYSYFDTIQSTMFDIFGESNIYTSECVQVFDNTYIDHEVLFIDYADKDEDTFIVGFRHKLNNGKNDDQCVGLQIEDCEGKQLHRECSCEKYGEMEYIKIPIQL